jgi:hypothetical protein
MPAPPGAQLVTRFCHSGENQRLQFMPNGEILVYGNTGAAFTMPIGNNLTQVTPLADITP